MDNLTKDYSLQKPLKRMLSERDREEITRLFDRKLENEVDLVVFTQKVECIFCRETRELVEDVGKTSDKIDVHIYDFVKSADKARGLGVDKIPAIVILGKKDYGIRFYGIPSGYEFATLTETMVDVSTGTTGLSEDIKKQLKTISSPVHIQVFVLPTCPYCPRAARLAYQFAIENDLMRSDVIEATEFPHLVQKYGVMGVPKGIINEKIEFVGVIPEDQLLNRVLQALSRTVNP